MIPWHDHCLEPDRAELAALRLTLRRELADLDAFSHGPRRPRAERRAAFAAVAALWAADRALSRAIRHLTDAIGDEPGEVVPPTR